MDDETGEMSWRRKFFGKVWIRRAIIWVFPVLYAASFILSIQMGYFAVTNSTTVLAGVVLWVYASGLLWRLSSSSPMGKPQERRARCPTLDRFGAWIGLAL